MDVDSGFSDLLQQAQRLNANMDTGEVLPRVERNLVQIRESAAKLAYRTPYCGLESSDVKASLLLSARGYDVHKVVPKLDSLSAAKTFEPLEPVRDTDIQGFLKNERENALLAVIEQTRKNTFDETSRRHWDNMETEWERDKQKILTALVDSAGETLDFIQEPDSLLSDSLAMHGRSTMDGTELAYARQVYAFNETVIQGGVHPNLVTLFTDVASKQNNINIIELWNVVDHMTKIPPLSADLVTARTSPAIQAAFVRQALKYLQQSYVKYIEMKVHSNLQQAQRGGVPGTFNLVRSFLNVQQQQQHLMHREFEDGQVDGVPTWAMIYHCMRCGDLQAASDVIKKSRQHLGDFPHYFHEYANSEDRRLSAQSEQDIRLQYHRSVRMSTDPYKRAVYCCVGRCDGRDDHSEVATSTDDYLWLKLGQVTFDDADACARDRLSLTQLQCLLLEEYGETHFAAYQQPYLYFRVLFLTAQFEAAIEFLARIDSLRCYALHTALILYDMKLLLLPSSTHALLLSKDTSDPAPLRRLNFVRLVLMYTKKFEVSDPREALQYFYFLRDLKTPSGDNFFMSCVSELVIETREFDMLLGQLQTDGTRRPGALDKFRMDTQKIIELVARDTENKGQFEDAVRLYDLGMNHEKVLELLNKLLSQVVSQPSAPHSNRDRLKQLALSVAQRYRILTIEGSRMATSTFHLQLDLMTFFDLYHAGNFDRAYSVMQDLKFLPLSADTVDQKVMAFRSYTDEIRRCLPDVLLATMTLILNLYRNKGVGTLRSPAGSQSGLQVAEPVRQTGLHPLRAQAQALITFAGMIPYRLPGDTNARLVQMEVQMN